MNDTLEQIQEALNFVRVALEDTSDTAIKDDLEAAIEMLEEAEHSLEVGEEMNEMMGEYSDNLEDLSEL